MVLDALRGYVQLASGLTEVNRQRAVAEAKALLASGGMIEQLVSAQAKDLAEDVGRQVQTLADDLIATSKANRQVLSTLVRSETERAAASLGLATAEEISALRRHVERLEQRLAGTPAARRPAPGSAAPSAAAAPPGAPAPSPAKRPAAAPVKKSAVKKSPVKKSAVKKSSVKKSAVEQAAASSAVKKSPVKKSPVKKSPSKPAQAAAPNSPTHPPKDHQ
jgi:polyhydroxyalkanoate synthesis regulator phasin